MSDSSPGNSVTPVGDTEAVATATSALLGIPRSDDADRERVVALQGKAHGRRPGNADTGHTTDGDPCPYIQGAVLWNAPTQYLGL